MHIRKFLFVFWCFTILSFTETIATIPPWTIAQSFGGIYDDGVMASCTDANGNIYMTGYFQDTDLVFGNDTLSFSGFSNVFIVKFDSALNPIWARAATGMSIDAYGTDITVDASGNILVSGYFIPNGLAVYFGPHIITTPMDNIGAYDMFLVKYDSQGNALWARDAGGWNWDICEGISVDAAGNVFVSGWYNSDTLYFGSYILPSVAAANSNDCFFVAKYNTNGVIQWAKNSSASAISSISGSYDLCADPSGGVYVSGYFTDTVTFDGIYLTALFGTGNIFLVKYDSQGNALWAIKGDGGSGGYAAANVLERDASGNIYMTGSLNTGSLTFGGVSLINSTPSTSDVFIAKFDSIGNILWAESAGDQGIEHGTALSIGPNGNVYIGGIFNSGSLDLGAGLMSNSGPANTYDLFVAKYDNMGQIIWSESVGGSGNESIGSISNSQPGELLVTGSYTSSNLMFDSIPLNLTGGVDAYFARMGSCSVTFTLQPDTIPLHWFAFYNTTGSGPFVFEWNWGDGSVSYGPTASHSYAAPGYYNICLTLTDMTGCNAVYCDGSTYINHESAVITVTAVDATTTGIAEHASEVSFSVYPQPADEELFIDLNQTLKNMEVQITDVSGRLIHEKNFQNASHLSINTSSFPAGMFLLRIKMEEGILSQKLLITH